MNSCSVKLREVLAEEGSRSLLVIRGTANIAAISGEMTPAAAIL